MPDDGPSETVHMTLRKVLPPHHRALALLSSADGAVDFFYGFNNFERVRSNLSLLVSRRSASDNTWANAKFFVLRKSHKLLGIFLGTGGGAVGQRFFLCLTYTT